MKDMKDNERNVELVNVTQNNMLYLKRIRVLDFYFEIAITVM